MSLTAREIEAALAELRPALLGTTIQEIVGIGEGELRITAAGAAGPISVCVGLRGELARIHRSTLAAKSNDTPPEWRALAGAAGATIVGIDQPRRSLRDAAARGETGRAFIAFRALLEPAALGAGRRRRPDRWDLAPAPLEDADARGRRRRTPPRAIAAASPPPSRFPAAGPHFRSQRCDRTPLFRRRARPRSRRGARRPRGVLRRRLHARAARIAGLLAPRGSQEYRAAPPHRRSPLRLARPDRARRERRRS